MQFLCKLRRSPARHNCTVQTVQTMGESLCKAYCTVQAVQTWDEESVQSITVDSKQSISSENKASTGLVQLHLKIRRSPEYNCTQFRNRQKQFHRHISYRNSKARK